VTGQGCSPVRSGPIAAANTTWVPHSTKPTIRICGYPTFCSPRPDRGGRPNASTLACVSGRSKVVPSTAASRQLR
jgi:hypothetical protein